MRRLLLSPNRDTGGYWSFSRPKTTQTKFKILFFPSSWMHVSTNEVPFSSIYIDMLSYVIHPRLSGSLQHIAPSRQNIHIGVTSDFKISNKVRISTLEAWLLKARLFSVKSIVYFFHPTEGRLHKTACLTDEKYTVYLRAGKIFTLVLDPILRFSIG